MSIEGFLTVNFLGDFALFGAVSRALGLFRLRRVMIATLVGSVWAALAAARPQPWCCPAARLAATALIAVLLSGYSGLRQAWNAAVALMIGVFCCGGIGMLLPLRGPAAVAFALAVGALACLALFGAMPPAATGYRAQIRLQANGVSATFTALVDTGNRLREPISGLPVLIAEAGLLVGLLPAGGCRDLRYGTIGVDGRMACFRPESVWIGRGGRLRRAPDIWVAVSPSPLPGPFRALAPCEFSLYM